MIYNIAGQPVRSLRDGVMESGWHSVVWDGRDGLGRPVSAGVYIYRLESARFTDERRMTLVR